MNPALKPITDRQAEKAVKALTKYGTETEAARALGLARTTLQHRLKIAEKRGIGGGIFKEMRALKRKRAASTARKHMVIPDGQVKAGVPLQHWSWIGQYMLDKRPHVVVNIGDFADMPSLSSYDKGKRGFEGRRYTKDIEAARNAMAMLMTPVLNHNLKYPNDAYRPEFHLTLGNHEYRIPRATEDHPELEGAISIKDLAYEEFGWTVHDFLKPVEIDGIAYAHYFITGQLNRPVTSARALATKKHMSCTMGHNQKTDIDMSQVRADGKRIIALFAGCCYLHDEEYLGPQGNDDRRQIVMCHEVNDGDYDPMFVSLKYLERRYS